MIKKTAAFIFAAVLLFALPYILYLRPLIVLSGSMEPAIHTGSLIFIDTKKRKPQPGDIVTFSLSTGEEPAVVVTHRIVREEDGLFITKGDANEAEDYVPADPEQIAGTFVFQVPFAGYPVVFLRSAFHRILSAGSGILRQRLPRE